MISNQFILEYSNFNQNKIIKLFTISKIFNHTENLSPNE